MLKYHLEYHLNKRSWYPWGFLVAMVIFNSVAWWFSSSNRLFESILATSVATAGFIHFFYAQHHQNTQVFIGLFQKFNERYDKLNERLNEIAKLKENLYLQPEDVKVMFDYFNLCAEEFFYYKAGYIDRNVWKAWLQGMRFFARNAKIHALWKSELDSESYYGFKLAMLEADSIEKPT